MWVGAKAVKMKKVKMKGTLCNSWGSKIKCAWRRMITRGGRGRGGGGNEDNGDVAVCNLRNGNVDEVMFLYFPAICSVENKL